MAGKRRGRKRKYSHSFAGNGWLGQEELSQFAEKLKELVFSMPPVWEPRKKPGGPGKPCQSPRGLTLLAILQDYTGMTDRGFEGFLAANGWLVELAELDSPPSRRSLYRYRKRLSREWVQELNTSIIDMLDGDSKYSRD